MGKVRRYLESTIKEQEEEAKRGRGRPPRPRNQDVSDWNGLGPYLSLEDVEGYDIDEEADAKQRSCLRCSREFKSLNNGNRVCSTCLGTKDMSETKFSVDLRGGWRPISEWTLINLFEAGYSSDPTDD